MERSSQAARRRRILLVAASVVVLASGCVGRGHPHAVPTTTVIMRDYSFAIDGPIVPGGEIHTINAGDELHMFGMGRLAPGRTVTDFIDAVAAGGFPPDFGGTIAQDISLPGHLLAPGNELRIAVPDLMPGNYVAGCFVAGEGDGVFHVVKGMVAGVTVTGRSATPAPAPAHTFTIALGAPVEGPAVLPAGANRFRIVAPGGAPRVQVALWRIGPGETLEEVIGRLDAALRSPVPPPGTGLSLADDVLFVLHDFADARETTLGVHLRPGHYVLTAFNPATLSPGSPIIEQRTIEVTG
jgi:hypothetical protein